MTFTVGKQAAIEFNPMLLGLGVVLAAFQGAIHYCSSFADVIAFESYYLFVTCTFVGMALACALISMVAVNALKNNSTENILKSKTGLWGVAFVCALVGVFSLFGAANWAFVLPLLAVGGLFFGAGLTYIGIEWGRVYAELTPKTALFHSAVSLMVSSVLYFSGSYIATIAPALAFVAMELIIGAVLLLVLPVRETKKAPTDEQPATPRQLGGTAVHMLWKPLIGAMITAFIFGLVWDPVASEVVSTRASMWYSWGLLLGPLIASILVIALLLRKPKTFTQHVFVQVFLPVAVALLLALPVVDFENAVLKTLLEVIQQASFAIIAIATWTSLSDAVRTTGLSSRIIFAVSFALCAVAMFVGMVMISFIGTGGKALCLVLLTAYLVLIVLSFVRSELLQKESRAFERNIFEKYLRNRCAALAEEYGLSPREKEVLFYMSRGYSHVYIAKELYVSENTVRTHVRHIYSKLHVSSREGLLALIDAGEKLGR
ncbi:MAG: hypothetical protein HGA54_04040 [Actinobacteria bacterium]|nr:hypothetical protein [Actinomycetota bacterium]